MEKRQNLEEYVDNEIEPAIKTISIEAEIVTEEKPETPIEQSQPVEKSKERKIIDEKHWIEGEETHWFEDYEIFDCIGAGGTGIVYKAVKHDKEFIIKIPRTINDTKFVKFEREILTTLGQYGWFDVFEQHPNIINIHESFENSFSMEYLEESINPMQERKERRKSRIFSDMIMAKETGIHGGRVAKVIYDLLEAVKHIHRKGIFHRDIKPLNLLFTHNKTQTASGRTINITTAKLYDFGAAFDMRLLENPFNLLHYYKEFYTPNFIDKSYFKERAKWKGFPEKTPPLQVIYSTLKRRDFAAVAFTIYNLLTGLPTYGIPGKPGESYLDDADTFEQQKNVIYSNKPIDTVELRKKQNWEFFEEIIGMCLDPINFTQTYARKYNLAEEIQKKIVKQYYHTSKPSF